MSKEDPIVSDAPVPEQKPSGRRRLPPSLQLKPTTAMQKAPPAKQVSSPQPVKGQLVQAKLAVGQPRQDAPGRKLAVAKILPTKRQQADGLPLVAKRGRKDDAPVVTRPRMCAAFPYCVTNLCKHDRLVGIHSLWHTVTT